MFKLRTKYLCISLFTLSLFSIVPGSMYAQQQTVGKNARVLAIPDIWKSPDGSINTPLNYEGSKLFVYSDREDNPAYASPGSATIINRAKFLQCFFAVEESPDKLYLKLVAFDNDLYSNVRSTGKENRLPPDAKVFGWIKKENLLLWQRCLVDPKTKISKKALAIINDTSVLSHLGRWISEEKGTLRIYSDPDLAENTQNENQIRLAQFMFIYKEDRGNYLVGVAPSFGTQEIIYKVYGWVSKNVVVKWFDRVCYEPNWETQAYNERMSKGIKASAFLDPDDAKQFYSNKPAQKDPIWDKDPMSGNRADPYDKRFPLLDIDKNSGIISTGIVSDIVDKSGDSILSSTDQSNTAKATAESLIQEKRNINIVFVINGDPGLRNYFVPLQDAIDQSAKWISDREYNNNNFNLGAVVYYPKSKGEEDATKVKDLSNNYEDVVTFIRSQLNNTTATTSSLDCSLFKGIDDALRMFSDRKTQTNYLVIIGSTGGERNSSAESALIDKMSHTTTGVIGFQVNTGEDPEFGNFRLILSTMMKQAALKINTQSTSDLNKNTLTKLKNLEPLFNANPNNTRYSLDYPISSPLDGYLRAAQIGKQMEVSILTETLKDIVERSDSETERNVAMANNLSSGAGEKIYELNAMMRRYMAEIVGAGISPQVMQKLASGSFQFFIRCYFKSKHSNLQSDVFKPVLLMTNEEVVGLQKALKAFTNGGTEDEQRDAFYDAYKAIYMAYTGSKEIDPNTFAKLTAADVQAVISGNISDVASKILKDYKMDDIKLARGLKSGDFDKLRQYFNQRIGSFNRFVNSEGTSFSFEDEKYYWVPIDDIP